MVLAATTRVESEETRLMARTTSQEAKQEQVGCITERLTARRPLLRALVDSAAQREVASKQKRLPPVDVLRAQLAEVTQAQREAGMYAEDLVEEMLALDSLAGLHEEDRAARRAALGELESLLEEVDRLKASLSSQRRTIEEQLSAAMNVVAEGAKTEDKGVEDELEASTELESGEESSCEGHRDVGKSLATVQKAPLPHPDDWAKLRLPLDVQARTLPAGHVLEAFVPGIPASDLKVEITDDHRRLKVFGLRLPTAEELDGLRQMLVRATGRPPSSKEDYLEAGCGTFGCILEFIKLPEDANVQRISASFRDGVLRVEISRRQRAPPFPSLGGYGGLGGLGGFASVGRPGGLFW